MAYLENKVLILKKMFLKIDAKRPSIIQSTIRYVNLSYRLYGLAHYLMM